MNIEIKQKTITSPWEAIYCGIGWAIALPVLFVCVVIVAIIAIALVLLYTVIVLPIGLIGDITKIIRKRK